ncbi:hypothetical protein [Microbispora sp. NPDC049633]|uniref:hypothetical protein n=1 Tax=Microbispora sp. NPDC049633 TaxID=3154355 RepID=UPI00343157AD
MALYEKRIGDQTWRAFTVDGSDEDARLARLATLGDEGWRLVDPEAEASTATEGGPFDPADHDVPQVLAYLEGADAEEAARVLDAEAADNGKRRKGILSHREEILAREQAADEDLAAKLAAEQQQKE